MDLYPINNIISQTINQKIKYVCEQCRKREIQQKLGYYYYSIQIKPDKSNLSIQFNKNIQNKENYSMNNNQEAKSSKILSLKKYNQTNKQISEIQFPQKSERQLESNKLQIKKIIKQEMGQK